MQSRSRIGECSRQIEHEQRACIPYGETGFFVFLSDCERQTAVHLGQSLIRTVRSQSVAGGPPAGASIWA